MYKVNIEHGFIEEKNLNDVAYLGTYCPMLKKIKRKYVVIFKKKCNGDQCQLRVV